MAVRDTDRGYRKLLKNARVLSRGTAVTVGVHAEEGSAATESGSTVGDVASVHEFGLGNHPERSFIRAWVDANKAEHEELERKMVESVLRGKNTPSQAVERFGLFLAADSQKFIQSGQVAPKTVKKDPDDNPTTLIASSQLVTSILHKVEA